MVGYGMFLGGPRPTNLYTGSNSNRRGLDSGRMQKISLHQDLMHIEALVSDPSVQLQTGTKSTASLTFD